MTYVVNALRRKERELSALIETVKGLSSDFPEGKLRIQHNQKGVSYYWRRPGAETNGTYIRKADLEIARKLAQNTYNHEMLKRAEKQLAIVQRLLSEYEPDSMEEYYNEMIPERQALIIPAIEPVDVFLKRWEDSHPDQQNPYPNMTDFYTQRGEHVRSKSEMIIADKLNSMGIPYRYEAELHLVGAGTIYPDLTILNLRTRKEWIWEHEGRMDEPEYSTKAVIRRENYEKNGYWPGKQLIFTCETKEHPLNVRLLNEIIERYLI